MSKEDLISLLEEKQKKLTSIISHGALNSEILKLKEEIDELELKLKEGDYE